METSVRHIELEQLCDQPQQLCEITDHDFFAYWAGLRIQYATTRSGGEVYDKAKREYERRIDKRDQS